MGQRKGLNLAIGHPVFVTEIRPRPTRSSSGKMRTSFPTA
ncbi:MAG: hypothetical protein ACLT76_10625 [Clostridium fessum]